MTESRTRYMIEFWAVILLPWILDIAGGRALFATLFGALLWGMAVVIATVRPRTQDARFRIKFGWALAALSVSWLAFWALSFSEAPRRISLHPESTKWLTWLHAGLLTAGLGMVLVLLTAAALWLFQDHRLRRSSWQRRASRLRLPSLESLGAVCERSVLLAFSSWGLGLVLAVIAAMLRWQGSLPGSSAWWLDRKVTATTFLWVALAVAFQLSLSASHGRRWLYKSYVGLSILFVVFFSWFMLGGPSVIHESLNWFTAQ